MGDGSELEVHNQGKMVGCDTGQPGAGDFRVEDPEAAADEDVVDASARQAGGPGRVAPLTVDSLNVTKVLPQSTADRGAG